MIPVLRTLWLSSGRHSYSNRHRDQALGCRRMRRPSSRHRCLMKTWRWWRLSMGVDRIAHQIASAPFAPTTATKLRQQTHFSICFSFFILGCGPTIENQARLYVGGRKQRKKMTNENKNQQSINSDHFIGGTYLKQSDLTEPITVTISGAWTDVFRNDPRPKIVIAFTEIQEIYLQLLEALVALRVANRPDRFEPRMRKRRPRKSEKMTKPRHELKRRMRKGVTKF